MKFLNVFFWLLFLSICFYACISLNLKENTLQKGTPVSIANDSLEYEIIIIDIGFDLYLNTIARPVDYYSQNYLENKNRIYVTNWNIRALNPSKYDASIYGNVIDYDPQIDYGMEVNYKLFNYFQFVQQKYAMRLDGGAGRPIKIR